jgi:hypothetical protein
MSVSTSPDVDARMRYYVYDATLGRGTPPSVAELSGASGLPVEEVRASLARLAAGRALVLQPESGEILMANPFSAVPTPFVVETPAHTAFGNCIWDALGIPAMLRQPGRIRTACGCCGEAMTCEVTGGRVGRSAGVVHFALPARRWWDDIVFT